MTDLPRNSLKADSDLTAEEHLRAAFRELRKARVDLHERYGPMSMFKRHPALIAGASIVGGLLLKRMLFSGGKKRRKKRAESYEGENDTVAGNFGHSFLTAMARNIGHVLPGLVVYWLAERQKIRPFKEARDQKPGI